LQYSGLDWAVGVDAQESLQRFQYLFTSNFESSEFNIAVRKERHKFAQSRSSKTIETTQLAVELRSETVHCHLVLVRHSLLLHMTR
jgi:hypothetical protein